MQEEAVTSEEKESKFNNIFNKKNIELELDGKQDRLPYKDALDVQLKANQIIFTSINNVFQRLLDNDLYNEAVLKKYVEYGLIGGPAYVSSISQVEDTSFLDRKYVVSGENGISVLRKEEVDVSDTLSGAYLGGTKVNKVDYINGQYIACTEKGIYGSYDRINWKEKISAIDSDVVDITFNKNFLANNRISAFDYLAVVNSGTNVVFFGHNGISDVWTDFSKSEELSDITIEKATATKLFSFDDDSKLYVGTTNAGLLASELVDNGSKFVSELGTNKWSVYDMAELPKEDEYENYLLATNYGIKQSRKEYGFDGLNPTLFSNAYVYDALKERNAFYVCTNVGLCKIENGEHWISQLTGKCCNCVEKTGAKIYVGTTDGVYSFVPSKNDSAAEFVELFKQSVYLLASFGNSLWAVANNELYCSVEGGPFEQFSVSLAENEQIKQLKANKNTLYVLTNKRLIAIVDGTPTEVFSWTESFAQKGNVKFAQNLKFNKVVVQVDKTLFVLDENSSTRISVELDSSDGDATCAAINLNNPSEFFVLLGNKLNRIHRVQGNYVCSPIEIDNAQISANKIAFYANNSYDEFNGLVLIGTDKKLRFLRYDGNYGDISLNNIAKIDTFNDVIVYQDAVYGLSSSNNSISKFGIKAQLALKEETNLSDNNGVSFRTYDGNIGLFDGISFGGTAHLSTFSNGVGLGATVGEQTILSSIEDLQEVNCGDFVGYIDNTDKAKTILVGKANSNVSAFNVFFGDGLTSITDVQQIPETTLPANPTVFNDICYRTANGQIANAMNFVGTTSGLYVLSAKNAFLQSEIPQSIELINTVLSANDSVYIATNEGTFKYTQFSKNILEPVGSFNGEIRHLHKSPNEKLFIGSSKNENALISTSFENGILATWSPVFSESENVLSDSGVVSDKGTIINATTRNISFTTIYNNLSCSTLPSKDILYIYKTNEGIRAVDVDKKLYAVTIEDDDNSFSVSALTGDPEEVLDVLQNGHANAFSVNGNLSVETSPDENLSSIPTKDFLNVETPNTQNIITLHGISSIELIVYEEPIKSVNTKTIPISCYNAYSSISCDFSGSNLVSCAVIPSIEISGAFLSNELEYIRIVSCNSDGIPLSATETFDILNPLDPTDVIRNVNGQELSAFISTLNEISVETSFRQSGVYSFVSGGLSVATLSVESLLTDCELIPLENSDAFYRSTITLSGISSEYSSPENNIQLSYETSAKIFTIANKEVPYLYETNDGVYYNTINTNENVSSYFGDFARGFFVKLNDGNEAEDSIDFLAYTGANLVKSQFSSTETNNDFGIIHITKTMSNESFNDVYYFKVGENFAEYPLRKTPLGNHDKNFSFAKTSNVAGSITDVAFEGNTVYAKVNDKLYCSTPGNFPNFTELVLVSGKTPSVLASCSRYTLVKLNDASVNVYEAGVYKSNFTLSQYGTFASFFTFNDEVYIETTDSSAGTIWKLSDQSASSTIESVSDFNLSANVKAVFENENGFNVVIGNPFIYSEEKIYDFKSNAYNKLQAASIVDLKVAYGNSNTPILYAATSNDIYQCDFAGFDSGNVQCSWNKKNNGVEFSDIKSIYLNDFGQLYVVNGKDLYVYDGFGPSVQLNDCEYSVYSDFLPDDYNGKITINDFKSLLPAVVKNDSINSITTVNKFVKLSEKELNNASRFIENASDTKYVCTNSDVLSIDSTYNDSDFELSTVKSYSGINISSAIITKDNKALWGPSSNNTIKETFFDNETVPNEYEYPIIGSNAFGALYEFNKNVYAGIMDSRRNAVDGGVYKIVLKPEHVIDDNDEIVKKIEDDIQPSEACAIEFAKDDYVFSYLNKNTVNNQTTLEFASNNEDIQAYLNGHKPFNDAVTNLTFLFNRYLFVSNGVDAYVYDIKAQNISGKKLQLVQLRELNGGPGLLLFSKAAENIGLVGYNSLFASFDNFVDMKIFDDINQSKYVALANNFQRGTQLINVLNDKPDFLIGSTFGLKYVYDNMMTRAFYDRKNNVAINKKIGAIEKVIDANNNNLFVVGSANELYEVYDLNYGKFRKIHFFDEDETVLDVFATQKNEYLIATSKGIYTTSQQYRLINDLKRFTIDNIYEIVNDELRNIINEHISESHKPNSLISKINEKTSSKLSFISSKDKHVEKYDASIANAVNIVENDIIDSITRGGENPNSESYVKVGIRNWAVGSLNPVMTYTNDGFVNGFTDASSGKTFDLSMVPYVVKNWKSGLKEIYVYVPSTGTYYANNPQGISNSSYSYNSYIRDNVPNTQLLNTLPEACTVLRVYLYNSYFKIKNILAAQCTGNSLPLKIYKDNVNADDAWKGVFDTVIQPSALRTLPRTTDGNVNNVRICMDELERICLDFSIYGTDAQAIRIIAES